MKDLSVKIKKLHERAKIPEYATAGSAGFDLSNVEEVSILPHSALLIATGLAFEIPQGYEMQIRPRSGLSLNHQLTVMNSPATIDSDYRGEVKVLLMNHGLKRVTLEQGSRIAQGVIAPVVQADFEEVGALSDTARGEGGFGSTGVVGDSRVCTGNLWRGGEPILEFNFRGIDEVIFWCGAARYTVRAIKKYADNKVVVTIARATEALIFHRSFGNYGLEWSEALPATTKERLGTINVSSRFQIVMGEEPFTTDLIFKN